MKPHTYTKCSLRKALFSTLVFTVLLVTTDVYSQSEAFKSENFPVIEENVSSDQIISQLRDMHTPMQAVDYAVISEYLDKKNTKHTRYQEHINGLPLKGAVFVVHARQDKVHKITGKHISITMTLPEFLIAEDDAVLLATSLFINHLYENNDIVVVKNHPKLAITKDQAIYIDKSFPQFSGHILPAYEVICSYNDGYHTISKTIILDATSGHNIYMYENIMHGSTPGKGMTNYYGAVDIMLDSISPEVYVLKDESRGAPIIVNSVETGSRVISSTPTVDYGNPWENSAVDALYGAGKFYDFMLEKFNFRSLDNNNFPMVANVDRRLYNNAFWNGQSSTYGAGDCIGYSPWTAIDIVGHEFAHGVTRFNSNLIYSGESGALNESFSDIMGKALEYYADPDNFSWVLARPIFRRASAFRTMDNPTRHNHPKYYKGQNWENRVFFSLGVHTNSAVGNFWFVLLTEGGQGTNEARYKYDVKPLGMDAALDIVFHTYINYLTPSSGYNDAWRYTQEAVKDLYPDDEDMMNTLLEAWRAVGLDETRWDEGDLSNPVFVFNTSVGESGAGVCDQEANDIDLLITYNGKKTLPKNSLLETTVSMGWNKISAIGLERFEDTLVCETLVLSQDLTPGTVFRLNKKRNIPTDSVFTAVNFYPTIKVHEEMDSILYDLGFYSLHINNTKADDNMKIGSTPFKTVLVLDRCDPNTSLTVARYEFRGAICRDEPVEFKIVVQSDSWQESFNKIAFAIPLSSSVHIFLDFTAEINDIIQDMGDMDGIYLDIYSVVNGNEYKLTSDSLNRYIGPFNKIDNLLDFSTVEHANKLIITPCIGCEQNSSVGYLEINHTSNNQPPIIDDCVSPSDFFRYKAPNNRSTFSKVKYCYDVEDYNDVVLRFKTLMRWNSPYSNMLKVSEITRHENTLLIETTKSKWINVEIPITGPSKGGFDLDFLGVGSLIRYDDIEMLRRTVSTLDNTQSLGLTFNNPAHNTLSIQITGDKTPEKLFIINALGQTVHTSSLVDTTLNIDISQWKAGMYIIQALNNGESIPFKVIVL